MLVLSVVILVFQVVSINACCSEASTIIQIKNYEGPIYLHAPQKPCEDTILHHLTPKTGCDFDCTCVSKPVSSCIPINTATQCGSTLPTYNVACPSLYQDNCITPQCTAGLYNVPYSSYQDQYCPAVQLTPQSVYCSLTQDDCSYVCGKCGRKYSY